MTNDQLMSKQETTHLFKRFCAGDGPSIEIIYKQCFPSVENWILKNSGSIEDAADTFQEGLIVMLGYCKKTFDLKVKTCGFLFGICHKIWLKCLRKKNKNPLTNDDISEYKDIVATIENLEEELRFAHCLRILKDIMSSLKEREQKIIILFYIEKKKDKEIAEILGYKNANTVKVQRFKALVKLKKLCSVHPDFEDFCHKLFA